MEKILKKMITKRVFIWFFVMQFLTIWFSLSSVMIKFASNKMLETGFLSAPTLIRIAIALLMMAIYAVFWQISLKHVPLSSLYAGKSINIFWVQMWAFLFFSEHITIWNILSGVLISVGIFFVIKNE